MVGRPGRSKGCFNCRRKKKGCDLARPSCGQCLRSRQCCDGYERCLSVVAYSPPSSTSVQKLQLSALEVQYIKSFWELYLPTSSQTATSPGRDWTKVINDRYSADKGLKNALLAVTLSRVGEHNGDRDLVLSGSHHYGSSLKALNRAIANGTTAQNEDVLASCLLLGLYELLCQSTSIGFNWQSHSQGMGQLIRIRGPQAFDAEDSHEIFVSARLNVIFSAVVSRKATFLNSPEWLTIPWKSIPKTLYDSITDVFAQLPAMFEMFDHVMSSNPGPDSWEPVLSECWRLDTALQTWRQNIPGRSEVSPTPLNVSRISNTSSISAVPLEKHVDLDLAQALSIYWTTCVYLYTIMRLIWQLTESPEYLLPPRTDPLQYCKLISQSLSYFTSADMGEHLLLDFTLCMGTALQYLALCGLLNTQVAQRMVDTFVDDRSGYSGSRIRLFLNGLQTDPIRMKIEVGGEGVGRVMETSRRWWGGGTRALILTTPSGHI